VPGIGHGKFGNCGNRLWKDLEVAVQSGSGKVAVGGRCVAVGMVWPDVAGHGKAWQWLCKNPERPVGAAARPCQVTLIWHNDSSYITFLTNLK
jgi:hypothetical protein